MTAVAFPRPAPVPAEEVLRPRGGATSAGAATLLVVVLALLAGLAPLQAVALASTAALVALVAVRPASAAYLWMFVTPLVVGIERGRLLPGLRINEALLALLVLVAVVRWGVLATTRRAPRPTPTSIDLGFLLLIVTGGVLPLLWMLVRGNGLSGEAVQSAAVGAKYYLLFLLFRLSVRTDLQARRCLVASLAAGVVVAVLAVLQSLGLFGVPELLGTYWSTTAAGRGPATVGNAHGAADLLVFNLAIALALALHPRSRGTSAWPLLLGLVILLGALGSGQVSAVIAVLVTLLAVGWVLRQVSRLVLASFIGLPLALLALTPVLRARLDSVDPSTGLPSSWTARIDNLSTYFWPELFQDYHWLLGVHVVPEAVGQESWQPVVFIESGHTWLLWIGGVPYLIAFLVFVLLAVRMGGRAARHTGGGFSVAGTAAVAAYATVFVLTALDPHLFLRGSADLAVPLLALATVGVLRARAGAGATGALRSALPAHVPPARPAPPAAPPRPPTARDLARAEPLAHAPLPTIPRPRDGSEQPRRRTRVLVLALVVAVTAGVAVTAALRDTTARQEVPAAAPAFDRVLVISGSALAPGTPSAGAAAAERLGAVGVSRVVRGAGYARSTTGGPPLGVDVRSIPDLASYDAVVVQGGEADVAAPAADLSTATLHLIDYLRAFAPTAAITLVGPLAPEVPPPAALTRVTEVLRVAAAMRGVSFLDPARYGLAARDPQLGEQLATAIAPSEASAAGARALVVSGSSLVAASPGAAQQAADLLGASGAARVFARAGIARNAPGGAEALTLQVRAMPDLASFDTIVIQGGEADNVATPEEVVTATLHLIDYVGAVAPSATLVLVGPIPAQVPAPVSLVGVSDALRSAADLRGIGFVDPIEAGWTDRDGTLGARLAAAARELTSGPP